MSDKRLQPRRAVGLLVKLRYGDVDEFAQNYATNLSDGGMFIRTRTPQAVGTLVRFKVELASGLRVLQGDAIVRWVSDGSDPSRPPGMGVAFTRLDPASRALVDAMLHGASAAPAPPPVAPALSTAPPAIAPVVPPVAAVTAPPPPPREALDDVDIDVAELVSHSPPALSPPAEALEPPPEAPAVELPREVSVPPPVSGARPAAPGAPPAPPVLAPTAPAAPAAPRPQTGAVVYLVHPDAIDETSPVIGIDLGTTNSACAVFADGKPTIIKSADGYHTLPSVVGLSKNGRLEVGQRARSQRLLNPAQSISGAKRLVGREFDSPVVQQLRDRSHFEIVPDAAGRAAVRLGQDTLMLEEVQGLVLRECKSMAEHQLLRKVSRAVVTCPAYYSEPQREAVRRAGALAGLKVERVLNEPTAAALAFGLNRGLTRTVLVYDLGGGTFDATLLRLEHNVFEVLATGGDVFLGGVDFDNQIVDLLLERFQRQHGRPFAGDEVALSRIADAAERAKQSLSEAQTYEVLLPMLEFEPSGTARDLKTTLTRADIEAVCAELVDRTVQSVQDVLLDARVKPSDVHDVIVVGGMSRMPLVRTTLTKLFGKAPHAGVNADEAVALGAALYAGTVDKVSSVVLIDVVPMTLGLARKGGAFLRLIERNTALPASKSFGLSTQEDGQDRIELLVFQGESSQVSGNDYVGTVHVEVPKGPKGLQVAITLQLDAECVLHVEARELRTRARFGARLDTGAPSREALERLDIDLAGRSAANDERAAELKKRAGGFWSRLKRAFSRG